MDSKRYSAWEISTVCVRVGVRKKTAEGETRFVNTKDISTIRRFLGVVEGVVVSMPKEMQLLIYDHLEKVEAIMDREEKESEN